MRFQVPQFIETETKIIGPFTLKQFLWVASGMAVIFLTFLALPLYLFIILSIPVAVFFGALAFIKIDNVPLFNYAAYSVSYLVNPRRYFFKKAPSPGLFNEKENISTRPQENFQQPQKEIKQLFVNPKKRPVKKSGEDGDQSGYIEEEHIISK